MTGKDFNTKVGQMIRLVRYSVGLTLQEVGDTMGLGKSSIVNIEMGRQSISAGQLWDFSQALHCGVHDFFAFDSLKDANWPALKKKARVKALNRQIEELEK